MILWLFFITILGYLLGSIPGGYIVGKLVKGVDVRKYGSGNIGTTNVLRVLGKKYALFVFLIDFGKGAASVLIASLFPYGNLSPLVRSLTGMACITGHNWPLFLRFKGGKGVATSAGVFLILTPLPFIFSFLTMVVVVGLTRYVSLGSMISAALLPLYIGIFMKEEGVFYIFLGVAVALLVVFRHRSNIKRLLAGKESKLGERIKIREGK